MANNTANGHEIQTRFPQHNPSTSTNSSLATVLSYNKDQKYKAEKRLVRRLDTFLLPVLMLMCCFQAIDKSALGIAKINGIERDLNMTQRQYNIAVSIFQAGFLVFQLPSNLLITKISPRIYLAICCAAWSTIAASYFTVQNYHQLLVVRLLLGVCDAPYLVGSLHLLSSWYTRRELAKRTSLILGAVVITLTFSFTISAGIIHGLDGVNGKSGWRWMYLIFGCSGVGISFIAAAILPNYPDSQGRNLWLSEDQQTFARVRIAQDQVNEQQVDRGKLCTGLKLALKDTRTWIFALTMMSRKSLEGIYYYLPDLIKQVALKIVPGSSIPEDRLALLLSAPPALLAAVLAFVFAWSSEKFKERAFHIAIPLAVGLVGTIMTLASSSLIVRYASMYLYLGGSIVGSGMTWAWVANIIQETPEKKAAGIAIVSLVGGIGSVYSPFMFRHRDAPEYHLAFGMITGFIALDILCVLMMRTILGKQNLMIRRNATEGEDVQLYQR